ncbi:MAG TPA: HAMP domain-containing sensor histidine kinase [Brevibacillus sp.]|nr:HAMP domain-containing sensor histidine kinase [Brevibacillus sp.]
MNRKKRRTSLFRYWTTRYLLTLCVGLLVVGATSSYWMQHSETTKRLDIMKLMAAEIAERVVEVNGQIRMAPFLFRILDSRQKSLHLDYKPILLVVDAKKKPLFDGPGPFSGELRQLLPALLEENQDTKKITLSRGEQVLFVKHTILVDQQVAGWVLLFTADKDVMRNSTQFQLLFIMLISLGLLGWLVIYLLTKKLSQPIKDVAVAANQIVTGNYEIHLDKERPEQEIYELNHSFKEMADRLRQLEMMRTELLAGVTHELKTPVTSISGLIQAVKDDIVSGEEAKEFLEICSKETSRLQKMVEDLLDFNSFAVGDIQIRKEQQNMNELIVEISHQWHIAMEREDLTVEIEKPDHDVMALTDPMRVQQILYNLLNNAAQAIPTAGRIVLRLSETGDEIRIEVQDNGCGIPEEEQSLIFERYFRGEEKKQMLRGLGLGLSFSRMIAQALGGYLSLKESSQAGSTFLLVLRK